jgi:hypothetical protein
MSKEFRKLLKLINRNNAHYVLIFIWLILVITALSIWFIYFHINENTQVNTPIDILEDDDFGDLDFDGEDNLENNHIDPLTGLDKDFGDLFAPEQK